MSTSRKSSLLTKAKNTYNLAIQYWHTPPKGKSVPYKEIAAISGAGIGTQWTTLLASVIGLNASNFLVGACIGLRPMDLQIMLNVANLVGIPLGIFRSWLYDNHNFKGGKFLPFIRMTAVPIVMISMIFVWLPYENMSYVTKAVTVEIMYFLLNIFLCFYSESYNYFQQIFSHDAQERASVMSISQVVYSLAPTITNLVIPLVAGLTWGLDNIWTYRIIYPIFTLIGLVFSIVFFRKVKERLVLPKKKPEPVRMFDAIREVAKNKYYWIIQSAGWVVFLESGYGVILSWQFVYSNNGEYDATLGIANTIIGNASLWSMLLAPLAIKWMGKRNLMITANTINIFVLAILFFTYKSLVMICVLWYFNTFINTFWNIIQHNIQADMRDYHQWKTGVRVDGLFGPLGMIGTVIGFFTGMVYPAVYEKMGLHEDYSVLYNDTVRENLFEVLIILSAVGAFLNLVPFLFYDLTENKHKAYVSVLKIRAMFENHALGVLDDSELIEAMEIIHEATELFGKEKFAIDKTALKYAKHMPKRTEEEKELRRQAIKQARADIHAIRERNLAIDRAPVIMQDLEKFSGDAAAIALAEAKRDISYGKLHIYEDANQEMLIAKHLPHNTAADKLIRDEAIKRVRIKKEASRLIRKIGAEHLTQPDPKVKEEIINRETNGFADSLQQKRDLRAFLKKESIYRRAIKPYTDAELLLAQAKYYEHYEELSARYYELTSVVSN